MKRLRHVALALAAVALPLSLAGCGQTAAGKTGSPRDILVIGQRSLSAAYQNEPYSENLDVRGGVGPYQVKVVSGALPAGLSLKGSKLSGTPTTQGTYKFTVQATDANLNTKVQDYTLNVGDLPPLKLKVAVPSSEIRGATRVPVSITAPRTARAARLVWQLPGGAEVTRVQMSGGLGLLAWQQEQSTLTVDMGFVRTPQLDEQLALIWVQPREGAAPLKLSANDTGFTVLGGKGEQLAQELTRQEQEAQREAEREARQLEQAAREAEQATTGGKAAEATPTLLDPESAETAPTPAGLPTGEAGEAEDSTQPPTKELSPPEITDPVLPAEEAAPPAESAPTVPAPTAPAPTTPAPTGPTPTEPNPNQPSSSQPNSKQEATP